MPQAPLASSVRRLPTPAAALFVLIGTVLAFVLIPQAAPAQTATPSEPASPADRPVLGILGLTAPENRGVTVARVVPDTGADEAGLETGDLIVDLEGNRVSSMEDLTSAMERFQVGDEVTITYERNGERRTAEVELGSSQRQRRRGPFEAIPEPDFGPNFPDRPGDPDSQSPASSPDYRPVITLFGLLITGALIAIIVILVRQNQPAGKAPIATAAYEPTAAAASRGDPLEVLRLRYAQGEITREEFLSMSADLNGAPSAPRGESPTTEL